MKCRMLTALVCAGTAAALILIPVLPRIRAPHGTRADPRHRTRTPLVDSLGGVLKGKALDRKDHRRHLKEKYSR